MDEKLTKRDRRFPWGVIPLILSCVLGIFNAAFLRLLTCQPALMESFRDLERMIKYAYYRKPHISERLLLLLDEYFSTELLKGLVLAAFSAAFILALCVVLMKKRRGVPLIVALSVTAFATVASCFDGITSFDAAFTAFLDQPLGVEYAAAPLALALLFLALVIAGELGANGKNPLLRLRGLFAGLAIASLGVYTMTAIVGAVQMIPYRLHIEMVTHGLLRGPFFWLIYYGFLLDAALLKLLGFWMVAFWVLHPYKRGVRAASHDSCFPIGGVLLLVAGALPFFFTVINGKGVELSTHALLGNLAFLATLALALTVLLQKRGKPLVVTLGVKCLAVAILPLVEWILRMGRALISLGNATMQYNIVTKISDYVPDAVEEALSAAMGKTVDALELGASSLFKGVPLVFALVFLFLIALDKLRKGETAPRVHGKSLFFWLALGGLSLFALFTVLPALSDLVNAYLDVGMRFLLGIKEALKADTESMGEIVTYALKYACANAYYVLFPALLATHSLAVALVKVLGWLFVTVWVAKPSKKALDTVAPVADGAEE